MIKRGLESDFHSLFSSDFRRKRRRNEEEEGVRLGVRESTMSLRERKESL